MSAKAKLKGLSPTFYVIGEAARVNLVYFEPNVSTTTYPVVRQVGYENRAGLGLLVSDTLCSMGVQGQVKTRQQQTETIFLDKKSGRPLVHIKPERSYGYVTNYLDIRVAKLGKAADPFTWESYRHTNQTNPIYLLADYDEFDIAEKDIPRLIHEAPGPVYVSTRKRNLSLYEGAKAVIISENDFRLAKNLVTNLVVTLGSDGASYNEKVYPVSAQTSGDNLGCRETFFAVFSYTHFFTDDYEYSIKMANRAASEIAKSKALPEMDKEYFGSLGKEILEYSVSK